MEKIGRWCHADLHDASTVQSRVWLWHCSEHCLANVHDGPYHSLPHHCGGLEVLSPAEPVQLLS